MPKCCLHMNKIKDTGAMATSYKHNFREESVDNADPAKKAENRVLIALPEGEDYIDAFKKKIMESSYYVDHKVYKNAIKEIEVMLTYNGRETSPEFDLDKWVAANVDFLNQTFGEGNVVSAVLHMDESTPHIHAVVVPMKDGHLRGKDYFDGKGGLSKMQDVYARHMEPLGLERGRKGSKAKHENIKDFYKAMNSATEKELPQVREDETAEEYRHRAQAVFQKENLRHFGIEKKNSGEIASLSGAVQTLERDYNIKTAELEAMECEIKKREKELANREAAIKQDEARVLKMRGIEYGLEHGALPSEDVSRKFGGQVDKLAEMGVAQMIADGVIEPEMAQQITK